MCKIKTKKKEKNIINSTYPIKIVFPSYQHPGKCTQLSN